MDSLRSNSPRRGWAPGTLGALLVGVALSFHGATDPSAQERVHFLREDPNQIVSAETCGECHANELEVWRSTSQPLPGSPSQSSNPALQMVLQEPLTHSTWATFAPPAPQSFPQAPQFCRSASVKVHAPVQRSKPAVHWTPATGKQPPQLLGSDPESTQVPLQQASPDPHALPHAPQFDGSAAVSVQDEPHRS